MMDAGLENKNCARGIVLNESLEIIGWGDIHCCGKDGVIADQEDRKKCERKSRKRKVIFIASVEDKVPHGLMVSILEGTVKTATSTARIVPCLWIVLAPAAKTRILC